MAKRRETLRERRERLGLSRKALATAAGVTIGAVWRLENDREVTDDLRNHITAVLAHVEQQPITEPITEPIDLRTPPQPPQPTKRQPRNGGPGGRPQPDGGEPRNAAQAFDDEKRPIYEWVAETWNLRRLVNQTSDRLGELAKNTRSPRLESDLIELQNLLKPFVTEH